MTITFGIHQDTDESVVETESCHQCDACMQAPDTCTNKQIFRSSRWCMNVCNANAALILNALGIGTAHDQDAGANALIRFIGDGEINANALLKAIDRTSANLLVRETVTDDQVIFCGVDYDRAKTYLIRLRAIAEEASRREDAVIWG